MVLYNGLKRVHPLNELASWRRGQKEKAKVEWNSTGKHRHDRFISKTAHDVVVYAVHVLFISDTFASGSVSFTFT